MIKGSHVVITGGAGFIGSTLAEELTRRSALVTVIDNLATADGSNLKPQWRFFKLDVAVDALAEILTDAEYVFHAAAVPRTQYCVENPFECHTANASGTLRLLELCRQHASRLKKFVYSSSCAIYGRQETQPIREDAPKNHGTPYALQKWLGEEYTRIYAELYGVPTVSLRYANVYGTKRQSEKGSYPNVLAAFSRQKREKGALEITGDGEQTRDFIHVFDVVDANIIAAESELRDGRGINISTGAGISINEIARHFNCPITRVPPRPGEARHLVLDNALARELLGWEPKIMLVEGMKIYFFS